MGNGGYHGLAAFKDLLLVSQLRGDHSTGCLSVSNPGKSIEDMLIRKMATDAGYFLWADSVDKEKIGTVISFKSDILMGHCRYATAGRVNPENAHPFRSDKYVLAHNGTLSGNKEFDNPTRTDSELLLEKIEAEGIEPVLNSLKAPSSYALSIYEVGEGNMYFARNGKRPLFIAYSEKDAAIWWASELEMLQLCLTRRNITAEYYNLDPFKLYKIAYRAVHNTPAEEFPGEVIDLEDKTDEYKKKSKVVEGYGMYNDNWNWV